MENKKLKIVQVTTFFHPVTGGVETQVEEISKKLTELGHEVEIFTSDSSRNQERILEKNSLSSGIKITRFHTWLSFSKFHKFLPGIFIKLLKTDFDVVHVHGLRKPELYLALLASKLKRKKIVVTTHNPFTADDFRDRKLNKIIQLHDATLGRWLNRFIDEIIYISPDEKFVLKNKFKFKDKQLTFIPNGISEIFFEESKKEYEDLIGTIPQLNNEWNGVVLAACRMNKVKGLQNLKLAVSELEDVLFLFVGGDDGYLEKLKGMYRQNKNVFFSEKYLKKEALRALMDKADLFVLPSLHEPFGLTIVEAVAAGVPVIATTAGGPTKVLDSAFAEFVNPEDIDGWKESIKTFFENRNERKNKIEKGKNFVQKYRWDNIIPQIIEVYTK